MNYEFPKGFLWGGATADSQYEGGFNEGGRGLASTDFVILVGPNINSSGSVFS